MTQATDVPSNVSLAEAAALVARLVSIRSYPGQEHDVQRSVAEWLTENGMPVEYQETGGAPNVISSIQNGHGPTLLFNGHVDTVLAAAENFTVAVGASEGL